MAVFCMKKVLRIVTLILPLLLVSGCTSYLIDRGRDVKDIVTATIGTGIGATARLGPLHAGLYYGHDHVGLKGGVVRAGFGEKCFSHTFDPLIAVPRPGKTTGFIFYRENFYDWSANPDDQLVNELRGKLYESKGIFPFLAVPKTMYRRLDPYKFKRYPTYYMTQLEVAVGLGVTVRLGLNPGELLDFILGWVGIDIFGDDVEKKRRRYDIRAKRP